MIRLVLGLVAHAARWHLAPRCLLQQAGYRWRPYCWQLDARHLWWQHRHCHCSPSLVVTITADVTAFDDAVRRAAKAARQVGRP